MMIQRFAASVLVLNLAFAPLSANAQLFGPSDEEKAREAAQDSGLADQGPAVQGRPPGVLGTLPMGSGPAPAGLAPQPQGGGSAQYDQAMNLMSRAQYSEASAAFRAYADANPGDTDLAPQA